MEQSRVILTFFALGLGLAYNYAPGHTSVAPQLRTTTSGTDWETIYDGGGFISFDASQGIVLEPKQVNLPKETRSSLILSKATLRHPVRNFEAVVKITTERQLRQMYPNAWEVFWFFFNYNSTRDGSKETNYLIFKPNGLELGIATGDIDQVQLATTNSPSITVGIPHILKIRKLDESVQTYVDGALVFEYKPPSKTKKVLLDRAGSIGIYTEDARIHVHSVSLQEL
jgi:hypothetical protein